MTFWEAQAGHRSAARGWALGCTALALGFAVIAGGLLSMLVVIPIWLATHKFPSLFPYAFIGTAIVFALWFGLRAALLRDGGQGLALAIGARAPVLTDLEEKQLQNVTEEMAIAAGMPVPRVLLLDAGPPNAAIAGSNPRDAVIVVTRSLLDGLNRDQTQAVLGHGLAIIANDDPRLGIETLAVLHTFGFLIALCEAPINRTMRHAVWVTLKAMAGVRSVDPAGRDKANAQLVHALSPDTIVESTEVVGKVSFPLHPRFLLSLPFLGVALIVKLVLLLLTLFLVGPFLWTMLRNRRYLADATAVQLTRQVDPLIAALEVFIEKGGIARGRAWAEHLFVTGAITSKEKALKQAKESADSLFFMMGAHPPLWARVRRLGLIAGRRQ